MGFSCISDFCETFREADGARWDSETSVEKEKIHSFVLTLVLIFILISCLTNYNLKHLQFN